MKYASLRQGLVGAWCPSLGATGYRLLDRSGYGNHGTLTNMNAGTDWVGDVYGTSLDFAGGSQFVSVPSVPLGTLHTCCMWIKPKPQIGTANFGGLLGDGTSNTGPLYVFNLNNINFGYTISTSGFGHNVPSLTGAWHHISSLRVDTAVKLYLDGQEVASGTLPANTSATVLRIGLRNADLGYYGQIDDTRLYSRDLSPAEIRLLASEPGIGLKPERVSVYFPDALSSRRRKILTGLT